MALTPRLELRQGQALVMTPQLQQAIKLLQLSSLDLSAYVEQELEQNPLLERDDGNTQNERDGVERDEETADDDAALKAVDSAVSEEVAPSDGTLDADYDDLWNNDAPIESSMDGGLSGIVDPAFSQWGSGSGGFDGAAPNLEQTLPGETSLRDHLIAQMSEELPDPIDRLIGLHIIDMLDESGYLIDDLEQISARLECPLERVETTLSHLQQFDPPGIFARDLAECLGLQLLSHNRLDPAMQALLDNLDLLAKRDLTALVKICGVDEDDIVDMVAEIRQLDPKPALAFDFAIAHPVVPDIIMRPRTVGGWIIELNNETLPKVLVNNSYYAQISDATKDKEAKKYISECYQSANWLVKSLHQRATTILKVASEIVRQQDLFFTKGVQHLRPLVLRDIAESIEMHESTVSRVTSNKYMSTPRGIYELKYFFSPSISGEAGEESHSAESVRHRIKAMIDAENHEKVLSDDKIVAILKKDGVNIARRTVAKYREAMKIPSSVQRRREKKCRL
jgi:RNA polymerase sigma-54 factor